MGLVLSNAPWTVKALGITAVVCTLAGLLAWGGMRAAAGVREVREAAAMAQTLKAQFEQLRNGERADTAALAGTVAAVQSRLDRAEDQLTPFLQLSGSLGWLPKIGSKLRSAEEVLDVGRSLAQGSKELLAGLDGATQSYSQGDLPLLAGNQFNEALVRDLAVGEPYFRSALAHFTAAKTSLLHLQTRKLPSEYQDLVSIARQVTPDLQTLSYTGLAAAQAWPRFLGYDRPRTYLIVAQNSDELRATGGFIPGAWSLTLEQGRIQELRFWDTVDVDDLAAGPPLPPEGLLQSLWAGVWLFRDAAWYPDFPTSARVIERLFSLGRGSSIDGVIGVNQWALEDVLKAVGPVTLPTGQELTPSTFMAILEEQTDIQGRGYVDVVLQVLLDRLRERNSNQEVLELLAAVQRSLSQKDIVLLFDDSALQGTMARNGWDGKVKETQGDYLQIVDSNVGFSKVNRNIAQQVRYSVDLQRLGSPQARLDIEYNNRSIGAPGACRIQSSDRAGPSYEEGKNTCYWDYLRVYVPAGSGFQRSTPFPMPDGALYRRVGYNDVEDTFRRYTESGKQVFAGFFTLEVGERRTVSLEYTLPARTAQRQGGDFRYRLLVQKQAGTRATPMDVTVRLPQGYRVRDASHTSETMANGDLRFSFTLDSDVSLELGLEPGSGFGAPPSAPIPAVTQFTGPSAIASVMIQRREVVAPRVEAIHISPQEITAVPGQRLLFTALALDSQRHPVRGVHFQWRTADASAGSISATGLFTTGSAIGSFPSAIQVSTTTEQGVLTSAATVKIISRAQAETRRLDTVFVYPSQVIVRPGRVVGLGALGWDEQGRFVQNVRFRWSVTNPRVGTVDEFGFFTASTISGQYPEAIVVTGIQDTPEGPVERRALVSVTISEAPPSDVLSQVGVFPSRLVLAPEQRTNLIVKAFDASGQLAKGVTFTWRMAKPAAGRIEPSGAVTAGVQTGEYPEAIQVTASQVTRSGVVQVSALVSVTIRGSSAALAPRLAGLKLIPSVITMSPGQRVIFSAVGLDEDGRPTTAEATWTSLDPRAGAIERSGAFTAGSESGLFPNAVRVQLSRMDGGQAVSLEAFATVQVVGELARVEIRPESVTLDPGASVQFRAVGFDARGLEIPLGRIRWSVENPQAGAITGGGLFTAGSEPGDYPGAVRVVAAAPGDG